MKIVLFNAPPRAGKDTAVNAMEAAINNNAYPPYHAKGKQWIAGKHKLAQPLKEAAHRLFGMDVPDDFFEDVKDKPMPEFMGKTPREVYIALSEEFAKPQYGKQFFGHIFARKVRSKGTNIEMATGGEYVALCSDLGFNEEYEALRTYFDAKDILIVRLERPGCSFANDSRYYLTTDDKDQWQCLIRNTYSQRQFEGTVVETVAEWLASCQ